MELINQCDKCFGKIDHESKYAILQPMNIVHKYIYRKVIEDCEEHKNENMDEFVIGFREWCYNNCEPCLGTDRWIKSKAAQIVSVEREQGVRMFMLVRCVDVIDELCRLYMCDEKKLSGMALTQSYCTCGKVFQVWVLLPKRARKLPPKHSSQTD